MNLKKSAIFILIFLSLMLCITSVSAENTTAADNHDADQNDALPVEEVQQTDSDNAMPAKEVQKATKAKSTPAVSQKSVKKIDTDADANDVVVGYKKNEYFKVTVKNDDTNKPIQKLKLKVKVYTKTKSKTYIIQTNSKGIALLNTKNLALGDHKVVVTSANSRYKVSEKAHIFVGKKYTINLKANSIKKLSNGDVLRVYTVNDGDEKEIKVCFKGVAKKTKIAKAVFYLKNRITGKIIKKTDFSEFDNGRWQYPDVDFSNRFVAVRVQVTYATI